MLRVRTIRWCRKSINTYKHVKTFGIQCSRPNPKDSLGAKEFSNKLVSTVDSELWHLLNIVEKKWRCFLTVVKSIASPKNNRSKPWLKSSQRQNRPLKIFQSVAVRSRHYVLDIWTDRQFLQKAFTGSGLLKKILFNIPLLEDFLANRSNPTAHQKAIESYLRLLPSSQV